MQTRRWLMGMPRWVLPVLAGLIALVAWYGLRSTPVNVAQVEKKTIKTAVRVSGEIEPADKLVLTSKTSGRIETVRVEAGDKVRKGDVLASFDTTELKLEKDIAEARYRALAARLAGVKETEPVKAEAALAKAKAALQSAEKQYERAELLYGAGAISKSDFEAYGLALQEAKTAVSLAEQEAKKVTPPGGYEIKSLSFQAQEALAGLELARSRLEQAVITSPFDGVVYFRYIEPGSYVTPGTKLFLLGRGQDMVIKSYVLEEEACRLKRGQQAELSGPVLGESVLAGEVIYVAPAAEKVVSSLGVEQTKVMVKVKPKDSSRLKPGFELDVFLITEKKEGVIAVPCSAIVEDKGATRVLVVENGKAVFRTVTTGISDGDYVEVTRGLTVSDRVVLEPDKVKPGQKVRPILQKAYSQKT